MVEVYREQMPTPPADVITITVYADKLARLPVETHHVGEHDAGGVTTIEGWLQRNVSNYTQRAVPLYSATLNDHIVPPALWQTTVLRAGDRLDFTVEPKEPTTIALVVISLASAAYSYYVASNIPDNYQQSTPAGQTIYNANAQGNRAKLMGVIAEVAGKFVRFPDIITAPFRQYEDNDEWVYMMMCLGVGDYQITDLKVGQTPVGYYAGDIFIELFEPGDDVTDNIAHQHIYTSPEVGRTSSGALEITYDALNLETGWTYDLSGFEMTSYYNNAAANFPYSVGEYFRLQPYGGEFFEVMALAGTANETATLRRHAIIFPQIVVP